MTKTWEKYQAVYVHIPFCVQKCIYCDFASYACCSEQEKERYVEALCKEIAMPLQLPIDTKATIYFGGGTPSTLSIEQITRIVQALKSNGLWQQPNEASIEVNPGTVDIAKLQALKALGFDRISMGVQSLNDEELCTIGRIHTAKQALQALDMAKQTGFKHINADVIYGLPGQTLASLQQTLRILTSTAIDHISVYGLIVEDGTPLAKGVEAGRLVLPDEDEAADMYDFVQDLLEQQGFLRYEISNYAKGSNVDRGNHDKGCFSASSSSLENTGYSRHNDVYWRYQPYAAFGASAVSFDGKARYTRPCGLREYENLVASPNHTSYDLLKEELTEQELLGEYIMMGLRRLEGVALQEAQKRFGVDVMNSYGKALEPYFEQGLVHYDAVNGRLALTAAGMAVGNQLFSLFV